MLLLHEPVPLELAVAGWVALLPALALALLAVRHRFLPESWAQHAWLAGIATIAVLWTMSVKTGAGVQLGMLGAGLYSVIFGRARAFLGLAAAVVLHTALTGGPAASLGLNGLLFAALPAWVGGSLQRVLERRLPHNLFVFIIGNGMFVSLVANAITGIAALLVSVGAQVPAAADNLGEYLAYTLMLAWGEALLSGMLFSALVVFRPVAVPTYSQDVYLPRRRR